MLALLADPQTWLAFVTLSLLEIILGFDNIIFISILVGRLPPGAAGIRPDYRPCARDAHTHRLCSFSIVWLTSLSTAAVATSATAMCPAGISFS